MAKRSIRVAFKAIVNTGSYESLHIELEESLTLDEDSDYQTERNRLIRSVKRRVEQEVVEAKAELSKPIKRKS